jgi:hypothetical protein
MPIYIDDFYSTEDGDDWLPAFERAQALHGVGHSGYFRYGGFSLYFRPRAYYFSSALHVRCPMSFIGSGAAINSGTVLNFPKGSQGLVFHGLETAKYPHYGGTYPDRGSNAQGSCVEKLMVMAVDPGDRFSPPAVHALTDFRESTFAPNSGAHGIVAYTTITLRDVHVTYFDGHGVYIYGNGDDDLLTPGTYSIAHFYGLHNCFLSFNGGDGLHVYGGECGHGMIANCQFNQNAGWGVHDASTLGGTTMIAGQVFANAVGGVWRDYPIANRDYGMLAAQIDEALSNPYTDPNALPMLSALRAILAGVLAGAPPAPNPADYPVLLQDLRVHSIVAQHVIDACRAYHAAWDAYRNAVGTALMAALGAAGFPDMMETCYLDFAHPYAVGANVYLSVYAEANGGGDGARNQLHSGAIAISSLGLTGGSAVCGYQNLQSQNHFLGPGGIVAERFGLLRANGTPNPDKGPHLFSTETAPTDSHPLGSIAFNSRPVPGGFLGWVMVDDHGAPGWRSFGAIDL